MPFNRAGRIERAPGEGKPQTDWSRHLPIWVSKIDGILHLPAARGRKSLWLEPRIMKPRLRRGIDTRRCDFLNVSRTALLSPRPSFVGLPRSAVTHHAGTGSARIHRSIELNNCWSGDSLLTAIVPGMFHQPFGGLDERASREERDTSS